MAVMVVGVAVAAGVGVWMWHRRREPATLRWEEVGTVTDLMLFPVKSAGGYNVDSGVATPYGLVVDGVVDRSFVVLMTSASSGARHVTGNMAPLLSTLVPALNGNTLTLTPSRGDPIRVDVAECLRSDPVYFKMEQKTIHGYDCGDTVATWLQAALYPHKEVSSRPTLRLLFVGDPALLARPATIPPYFHFPQFKDGDMQVYHDNCAFLVASSSSLDDLNSRLSSPVTMQQLRPNIVVEGQPSFDEDDWAYLRIGEKVVLRTVKPREACFGVTVRPDTGERQQEVIDVLRRYRVPEMPPALAQHWRSKPFFGILMALDVGGEVRLGDTVWAVRKKPNWKL